MRSAPTSSKTKRTIASRLAAAAVAVALVAPLPSCGLGRFPAPDPVYDAWAVVRNAAGVEVVVKADADSLFGDEMFKLAVARDDMPQREIDAARTRFRRAVRRRLEAIGGNALLSARFGAGPWCFASAPTITYSIQAAPFPLPIAETGDELPDCSGPPPPPECANAGEEPLLGVDPPELSFGDVPIVTTGPPMAVTLTNEGTGVLCLASIVHAGDHPRDFVVDDSDCRPSDPGMARRLLDSGESCTVNVTFRPSRPAERNATLRISSNDPTVLREFPVSGSGLTGTLVPRPASICAPRGPDGCFRAAQTFTNPGPGSLPLHGISGWQFDWTTTCTPAGDPEPPRGAQTVPVGGTVACTFESCLAAPRSAGALMVLSAGLADDPEATLFDIRLVAQLAPSTCTP